MLQNNPHDISIQIDRILSSNITSDIFGSLYDKLITSPLVSKKSHHRILSPENIKSSNKKSQVDKSMFQENLYEKAEQIFKLHSMLENQIENINQLVKDNQILESQNQKLKKQIQIIKIKYEQNKVNYEELIQLKIKEIQEINHKVNKQKQNQKEKTTFTINKQVQCQINRSYRVINLNELKLTTQCNQLKSKINQLEKQIQSLKQNNQNLNQSLNTKIKNCKCPSQLNTNLIKQKDSVEYYQSVFLKTQSNEILQAQQKQQKIRQFLFGSSSQSFFDLLQSIKYRGQMIQGRKTGLSIQEYQNSFKYEGFFKNNQRSGLGRLFYQNQLIYEGQWTNGIFDGKGTIFFWQNIEVKRIQGNFKNGLLNGYALITFKSGSKSRVRFKQNALQSQPVFNPQKN